MKITMTTPMEGDRVSRLRGDELELDDTEAQRLVDATFAVRGWLSQAAPVASETPAPPVAVQEAAIPAMHPNDVALVSTTIAAPAVPAKKPKAVKAPAVAERGRG